MSAVFEVFVYLPLHAIASYSMLKCAQKVKDSDLHSPSVQSLRHFGLFQVGSVQLSRHIPMSGHLEPEHKPSLRHLSGEGRVSAQHMVSSSPPSHGL